MEQINISRLPNQSFFVIVGEAQVNFRLHVFNGLLYCDLYVNGVLVSASTRCNPNQPLLPKYYNESIGNFMFVTTDDRYPDAEDFGDSCRLVHITADEIRDSENGKVLQQNRSS